MLALPAPVEPAPREPCSASAARARAHPGAPPADADAGRSLSEVQAHAWRETKGLAEAERYRREKYLRPLRHFQLATTDGTARASLGVTFRRACSGVLVHPARIASASSPDVPCGIALIGGCDGKPVVDRARALRAQRRAS